MSVLRYRTIQGQLSLSILEPEEAIRQLDFEVAVMRQRYASMTGFAGLLMCLVVLLLGICLAGWGQVWGWF